MIDLGVLSLVAAVVLARPCGSSSSKKELNGDGSMGGIYGDISVFEMALVTCLIHDEGPASASAIRGYSYVQNKCN